VVANHRAWYLQVMTAHAPTGSLPHLGVAPDLWDRLEKLARSAGRSTSELADVALRDFLDESEQHLAAIDEGIAAADAGDLIGFADVEADVQRKLAALSTRR
jgi:predicted transcriptional regulator